MGRTSKYGVPTRVITLSLPEEIVIALKGSGNASGALSDLLMENDNAETILEIDMSKIEEYRANYIKARLAPVIKRAIMEIIEETMSMSAEDLVAIQDAAEDQNRE